MSGKIPSGSDGGNNSGHLGPYPSISEIQKLFPELEIFQYWGLRGNGTVYKARQPALDRFVSLKILSSSGAGNPHAITQFQAKGRALARLNHPNIVTVHDSGVRQGNYYYVMEFVDGGDLGQLIKSGALVASDLLDVIPQICSAIQYAHDMGIPHRNTRASNILLDTRGKIKMTNFMSPRISQDLLEATGEVLKPDCFFTPEHFADLEPVEEHADIRSLAVVIHEMLTCLLSDSPSQSLSLTR